MTCKNWTTNTAVLSLLLDHREILDKQRAEEHRSAFDPELAIDSGERSPSHSAQNNVKIVP